MTTRPTDEEMDRCERLLTGCDCSPGYSDRGLTDPNCMACQLGSEVIDTFKAMRAELTERQAARDGLTDEMVKAMSPAKCPITGREYFMAIEHPERGWVATYGGPFDSYTIPEPDDDGSFRSERFDHDADEWVDGGNPEPYELVSESDFNEMWEAREKLAALQSIAQPVRVPDELMSLLRKMVEIHDKRQAVLTVHMERVKQLLSTPPQPQQAVPDGWKLVPIRSTGVMESAAKRAGGIHNAKLAWRAWLSAAPEYNGKKEG